MLQTQDLQVILMHHTDLDVLIKAIRVCYDSEYAGKKTPDKTLIRNLIKRNHTSPLEHIVYSFYIVGLSRAALQELARHRIASLSVMSTRYTLNKTDWHFKDIKNKRLMEAMDKYVNEIQEIIKEDSVPNDVAKYSLPDALTTKLVWTINARSLRNFFTLRFAKEALLEMNELSLLVYESIRINCPDHAVLYEEWDLMKKAIKSV